MAIIQKEKTVVVEKEKIKEVYQRNSWAMFGWSVLQKATSIGKELHINTKEKYDAIYLNGEKL